MTSAAASPSPTIGDVKETGFMQALRNDPRYAQGLRALDEADSLGKQAQKVAEQAEQIFTAIDAHRKILQELAIRDSRMEQVLQSESPSVNTDRLSDAMHNCQASMQREINTIRKLQANADSAASKANQFKVLAECKKFAAKQFFEDMLADIASGALPHPGEPLAALTAQITNL